MTAMTACVNLVAKTETVFQQGTMHRGQEQSHQPDGIAAVQFLSSYAIYKGK